MAAVDISSEALSDVLDMFRLFGVKVTGSRETPHTGTVRLEIQSDLLPDDANLVTGIVTRDGASVTLKFEHII